METTQFVRRPFYVEGIRVTRANMAEISEWCGGTLKETHPKDKNKKPSPFIEVEVHRPANDRQRRAFVGDWVLKAANGFKIYTDHMLKDTFSVVDTDEMLHDLKEKLTS